MTITNNNQTKALTASGILALVGVKQPFTPTHHAEAENCDVAIVEPRQALSGRSNWLLCRNSDGDEWYIPESELTEIKDARP